MKKRGFYFFFAALGFLFNFTAALACTDIQVRASDGSNIIARSMEFSVDMQSNLRTSTQGRVFNTTAPNGKAGLAWQAKYGYVYLDAFNLDVALDGMNETGLSVENLYLPGYAEYQTVPVGKDKQALPYLNFADWVLGNFKSVDEVKSALAQIYVYAQAITVPGHGNVVFPLHFAIHDASGKGIVVEYLKGKLNIYDYMGVMTNSPGYQWHLDNLQNYIHLAPINPPAVKVNGITYEVNGVGFGMIGLPGDVSPPSRFVKMATLLHVAFPVNNANSALNLAQHIINNVDIPLGLVREPSQGDATNETTQWVVFKDLNNKIFYYRTYGDLTLRSVSLNKLSFSPNAARLKMPIARAQYVDDLTGQFMQTGISDATQMAMRK
ncbi:MAG TPA: choloylglycine hydrolase family protein [Coxiellaceae bacterium]|nr:choloylglycine hydrolase family protein [Coxiellaceae bacterium]